MRWRSSSHLGDGGCQAGERGGDLLLVRLLVLAKANVAIDAKDGLVRIGFIFGREIAQGDVQRIHKPAHRLLDSFFEEPLARQEPFTIVVAREAAKKLKSFRGEARKW